MSIFNNSYNAINILNSVVIDDKLYVANSGDCKGVLLRNNGSAEEPEYQAINISKTFSANKKYE